MIPTDPDELSALAGEYVLGLLEPADAREVEAALVANNALKRAVVFWEQRLHPLSAIAPAAEPPADMWERISARLESQQAASRMPVWWNNAAPWRWATGALAVAAAVLLFFVAVPPSSSPSLVAVLNSPKTQTASFVATAGRDGLVLRTVASASPPAGRAYELWAIYPHAARPAPLGVISADGALRIASLPAEFRAGTTLAISIEPPGGSPTGQPTGPVVFTGAVTAL